MIQFFEKTPLWVWPLIAGLVFLGLRSTKDPSAPIWLYYLIPFLGLLGLKTVYSLQLGPLVWLGFGTAFGIGAATGFQLQRNWIIEKTASSIRVKGEWFTFTMIMVLFFSNFVLGAMRAISPQMVSNTLFLVIFVAFTGIASGSFTGRSIRIIRAKKTVSTSA